VQPTVYAGARFHTLDDRLGTVPALAVRGERIVAAGTLDECRDAAGAGSREVDLGGATVVPGLVDSHIHTAQYARSLVSVDLHPATSLQQALDAVRDHAAMLPPGAWLTGGGWDCHRWPVPVQPNRRDLDAVVPDRPVVLPSIDRHTLWVNSVALQRAGIDRDTPDPVGGEIVRDADGEPTGILREAAGSLISEPDDRDALPGLLRSAMDRLLSHGLTGVHDIDGADAWSALETLRAADDLPMRVHKLIPRVDLAAHIDAGHATGDGDSWLRTGPVKLFTDGALGSHSCLMTHGFADQPDNHGIAVTPYPELLDLVLRSSAAGVAVAAHAIGDAANHQLIDAFTRAIAANPASPLRYRIEHTQYLPAADVARIARLGIIASMQPTHCTSDIALTDTMLAGQDLACYAWRSLLDAGAVVTFGSDAPVEDPNPWLGIHAAVTRQRTDGTPAGGWQPHERLTLDQALRAYTVAPAYASYSEQLVGRLRPGMLADFAVLATDPFEAEPAALHEMRVSATVVGGQVRWSA
jgi:predicted amidohydrolase YtcJ